MTAPAEADLKAGTVACASKARDGSPCKHPATGTRFGHRLKKYAKLNETPFCTCHGADPYVAWGRGTGFRGVVPIKEGFAACAAFGKEEVRK